MRLDDSRARAMATRFVRECEEDAVAELNKVHRDYKVKRSFLIMKNTTGACDAFLNKQVIGSNRYSVGVPKAERKVN